MLKSDVHIFYHANCLDGMGGFHFLAKKLRKDFRIVPHAINYGYQERTILDAVDANSIVFFVDFTPRLETGIELINTVAQLIILDHHVSAEDTLISLKEVGLSKGVFIHYASLLSGAEIAARYDYRLNTDGSITSWIDTERSVGLLAHYLGIRDRWVTDDRAEKQKADSLHAYLSAIGWNVNDPLNIVDIDDDDIRHFIHIGELLASDKRNQAEKALSSALTFSVNGCMVTLGYITPALGSVFGECYYDRYPEQIAIAVGIVYSMRSDMVFLSIRCNQGEYARRIAEHLHQIGFASSGGGHNRASGAKIENWSTDKQSQLIEIIKQFLQGN